MDPELGDMLSLLVHDLKNPLAAILTNLAFVSGALGEPRSLEDTREAIVDAKLACESMQRFVDNLELVARELTGRASLMPLDPAPLDLSSIADEAADRQREAASDRRVRISMRVRDGGAYARADRDLVLRAMENLVANAVQCAPSGTEIELVIGGRVGPSGAETELVVLDEGPIVPPKMRDAILTRAGQASAKGRAEARYGRGLSMHAAAIAARCARGRVEIGEERGRSALRLVLPRLEDDDGRPSQV